jgi:hypothetical protein
MFPYRGMKIRICPLLLLTIRGASNDIEEISVSGKYGTTSEETYKTLLSFIIDSTVYGTFYEFISTSGNPNSRGDLYPIKPKKCRFIGVALKNTQNYEILCRLGPIS